ncbi:MAG: ribonuclease, partial [Thermoleophilia bacterium]|nr:ribonuclease [Thermoleophilia bacterium]
GSRSDTMAGRMDLDLVFLGTAASVPTARRGLASALVRPGGARQLFDCGEGTQRQLMRSTGLAELDVILLTHLHADHVLGLPGMLKTFGLRERDQPLTVTGPPGLKRFWRDMQFVIGRLPYEVDIVETAGGEVWSSGDAYITAIPTEHGVASVGYVLDEHDRPGRFDVERAQQLGVTNGPDFGVLQRGGDVTTTDGRIVRSVEVVGEHRSGRRVVYTGDTEACSVVRDAARDATLLIHEATFLEDDCARARQTHHATAHEAALTAAAADVQLLALTHISTRYTARDVLAEARAVFADTIVARDFDLIDLPYPERGAPVLVPGGGRPPRQAPAPV